MPVKSKQFSIRFDLENELQMFNKAKDIILIVSVSLLIFLWVYTAASKLSDITEFRRQLYNQSFTRAFANVLLWIIPSIELITALLLLFKSTRFAGLIFSLILMIVLTCYIALVLIGYFERVPCSCGGVLRSLTWETHLWFNLFFLFISFWGSYLYVKAKKTL